MALAYIKEIKATESEPTRSAFDPYMPTAFGEISFKIGNKLIHAETYDRSTDQLIVEGNGKVLTANLYPEGRQEIYDLFQEIWDLNEAKVQIPNWLRDAIASF